MTEEVLKSFQAGIMASGEVGGAPWAHREGRMRADDLNQEWDDLKDVERMEYLESRFGTALAAIELRRSAGRDPFNYAARTGAVEG